MRNRRIVVIASGLMLALSLALLTTCLVGCSDTAAQAQLSANADKIQALQAENARADQQARDAYARAVAANDELAKQLAQSKIDAAANQAKNLDTAKTLNDAAQLALENKKAARQQDWASVVQTATTIGGLLPPPFNLIGVVGAALIGGGLFGRRQGLATGAQALGFQADVIQHAQLPSSTPASVATHVETAKSNLSGAAAKLYDAAPVIQVTTAAGPVGV